MKFNLFFLTVFLYLITIVSSFSDYPATSIGVIDINRVLTEAKAAKNAGEQIEKVAIDIENEIKEKDEEIIKEQNKLIESQSIMAPEAFEAKRNEYEKKVQNYNIERQEKLGQDNTICRWSRKNLVGQVKTSHGQD